MRTVSILLPARNEEHGVAAVLSEIPYRELRRRGYKVDVVVVDGHSNDRTRQVAESWGARVVLQEGRGKGMAVRSALPRCEGEVVVMIDADRTYPAWDVPAFLDRIEAGADVVLGTRMRGHIHRGAMSATHRFGNRGLSFLASVLHGRRVTDVCTGMWAFRKDAVLALDLTSREFEIEAELFARAVRARLVLEEIPIDYRSRVGATKLGGVRDGVLIGWKLLSLRLAPGRRPVVPSARGARRAQG